MSAEETELTFVRCPSCRSLVPAVATRCRMCGHLFEEKSDEDSLSESSVRRRVRQKSMWGADQPEEQEPQSVEPVEEENFLPEDSEDSDLAVEPEAPLPRHFDAHPYYAEEDSTPVEPEPMYEEPVAEVDSVEPSIDQTFSNEIEEDNMAEYQSEHPANGRSRATVQSPQLNEDSALLGWFVNFNDDERGAVTEIREGRFIIGQDRLRITDMVIDHNSISTPHCIVSASSRGGFRVQDLMSEHGTAVRKHESDSWQQETGPMKLEHGDWLKLGEYEVMVCLIPYSKKKK